MGLGVGHDEGSKMSLTAEPLGNTVFVGGSVRAKRPEPVTVGKRCAAEAARIASRMGCPVKSGTRVSPVFIGADGVTTLFVMGDAAALASVSTWYVFVAKSVSFARSATSFSFIGTVPFGVTPKYRNAISPMRRNTGAATEPPA